MNEKQIDPEVALFWSRVDKSNADGCWPWAYVKRGYNPNKRLQRRAWFHKRSCVASRVAWEVTNGPIPEGLYVCHKCDNPACCNPSHLFLGTQKDNMSDCSRKGRVDLKYGEKSATCKLTMEQVIQIRAAYAQKNITQKELAIKYGVLRNHIWRITKRLNWKHIP